MRVTTGMFHDFSVRSMQARQADIFNAQSQVSTGRRINKPSDAPVDALRVLERTQTLNRITQYDRNIGLAKQYLQQQDSLFGEVVTTLQSARDLALQMNNSTMGNENRRHAAIVLRDKLEHMVGLANTRDATGSYMFSGFMGTTQPFTIDGASGTVLYNGDQGVRQIWVSEGRQMPLADSGDALFMQIPGGNGTFSMAPNSGNTGTVISDGGNLVNPALWQAGNYALRFSVDPGTQATTYSVIDAAGNPVTDDAGPIVGREYKPGTAIQFNGIQFVLKGQPNDGDSFAITPSEPASVFAAMKELADQFDIPKYSQADEARLNNAISNFLINIDQALEKFSGARAKAGDRLNAIEAIESAHQAESLLHEQTISSLQDTDYAESISKLSRHMQALEAAQKAYGTTKDLSLFNYL